MSEKLRQGLGLLAVAVLALLVYLATGRPEDPTTAAGVLSLIAGAVMVVCAVVGLVFIAVGLLKPQRD